MGGSQPSDLLCTAKTCHDVETIVLAVMPSLPRRLQRSFFQRSDLSDVYNVQLLS